MLRSALPDTKQGTGGVQADSVPRSVGLTVVGHASKEAYVLAMVAVEAVDVHEAGLQSLCCSLSWLADAQVARNRWQLDPDSIHHPWLDRTNKSVQRRLVEMVTGSSLRQMPDTPMMIYTSADKERFHGRLPEGD